LRGREEEKRGAEKSCRKERSQQQFNIFQETWSKQKAGETKDNYNGLKEKL